VWVEIMGAPPRPSLVGERQCIRVMIYLAHPSNWVYNEIDSSSVEFELFLAHLVPANRWAVFLPVSSCLLFACFTQRKNGLGEKNIGGNLRPAVHHVQCRALHFCPVCCIPAARPLVTAARRWPLVTHHSPAIAHHSPLVTRTKHAHQT